MRIDAHSAPLQGASLEKPHRPGLGDPVGAGAIEWQFPGRVQTEVLLQSPADAGFEGVEYFGAAHHVEDGFVVEVEGNCWCDLGTGGQVGFPLAF